MMNTATAAIAAGAGAICRAHQRRASPLADRSGPAPRPPPRTPGPPGNRPGSDRCGRSGPRTAPPSSSDRRAGPCSAAHRPRRWRLSAAGRRDRGAWRRPGSTGPAPGSVWETGRPAPRRPRRTPAAPTGTRPARWARTAGWSRPGHRRPATARRPTAARRDNRPAAPANRRRSRTEHPGAGPCPSEAARPLAFRLSATNRPETRNISDMKNMSLTRVSRPKPANFWGSTTGNAVHRIGSAVNAFGGGAYG